MLLQLLLIVFFVGVNNACHNGMAHHIGGRKLDKPDMRNLLQDVCGLDSTRCVD
jgi:hypothetical protein